MSYWHGEIMSNGNLLVPARAEGPGGIVGDGAVEIGPDDPSYQVWREWLSSDVRQRADDDDHYYGAWVGGKKSQGGHPAGGKTAKRPENWAQRPSWVLDSWKAPAGFSRDEVDAVHAYQQTYENVDYIQGNPDSPEARAFASAVAKCPASDGVIYRGIRQRWTPEQFADPENVGPYMDAPAASAYWSERQGKVVTFHEPVSTIGDLSKARKYGDVVFRIEPRSGAARDISQVSWLIDYHEVILAPGRFRVDGVETVDDEVTVVRLTDITEGPRDWLADGKGGRG